MSYVQTIQFPYIVKCKCKVFPIPHNNRSETEVNIDQQVYWEEVDWSWKGKSASSLPTATFIALYVSWRISTSIVTCIHWEVMSFSHKYCLCFHTESEWCNSKRICGCFWCSKVFVFLRACNWKWGSETA